MPLTVLSVAYPFAPVGADSVGGAEQVLAAMDEALVARGHRSLVVARAGSRVAGDLIPIPVLPPPTDEAGWRVAAAHVHAAIAAAQSRGVDLVHMHAFGFERLLPAAGPPVLVTLHLPLGWYPPGALRPARPGVHFNCVSRAQQRQGIAPAGAVVVGNGVAVERFLYRRRKFPFVLALGRVCPEKGFHLAADAAAAGGRALVIAGEVFAYPEHQRYHRQEIVPRLGRHCRFVGAAGFARKRRLLAAARCLLVPSLAPETSSLVALEAMASGTPVVAFRSGALPEIVESGHTGFLVDSVGEMTAAIEESAGLPAHACRRRVAERFSLRAMVDGYLALYRGMV
jgi:glycosyltransferase involved in cell wall biosynthesis